MGSIRTASGSLVCDGCASPGARLVRCTHRIRYPEGHRLAGSSLPYCSGWDVCASCLRKAGGAAKLHERCAAPAAARNAELAAGGAR